jgi:hypothetical protein
LLDIFAAAVWTVDLAFLVVNEGQDFVEELLSVAAQKFVVGHGDLHSDESDKENSRRSDRTVQCGSHSGRLNPEFSSILFSELHQ